MYTIGSILDILKWKQQRNIKIYPSLYASLDNLMRHSTILCVTRQSYAYINNSARVWISLIILTQLHHQNYYDQSSFSVRVIIWVNATCLKYDICFGPQGFFCICALPIYGFAGLAVCICQTQYAHLLASDINACFGAVLDFSQKILLYFPSPIIRICGQVMSTFSDFVVGIS